MVTLRMLCFVVLLRSLLGDLVQATPIQTPPSQPKDTPKSALVSNRRGEALLFDTNSTQLSMSGPVWWTVAVSPDGKKIATGQVAKGKGEIKIWDADSGKIAHVIPESHAVRFLAYSPDGSILAAGCYGGQLHFYTTSDHMLCAEGTEKFNATLNGICFFKNGKYLAAACHDNFTRIMDVGILLDKNKLKGLPKPIHTVAIFEGHTKSVFSVAVSPDGKTLLTGGEDRTARCYDIPDSLPAPGAPPLRVKKERQILDGHNSVVSPVAISPDGELFATGDWAGLVLIRGKDGKTPHSSFKFQSSARTLAFSSDGKYLAAGAGNISPIDAPGEVRVWDIAGKKEAAYRGDYPLVVRGITFTPDGKTVASVGPDQALTLWRFAENDRKRLAPPVFPFTVQPLLAAAISPDGSLLAFSGESKSIYIYNRSEEKLVVELTGHDDVVPALEFSPDGNTLASASYDKTIKLWNIRTWKEERTLTGHKGWVIGLSFSPDGQTLATGGYDKSLRIWEVKSGEMKSQLNDHTAGIRSVAFSPDGKKLVSGGSDRNVRIWDVAEGKALLVLKGHKQLVRSVAFSPDGKSVATGSEDRTVKQWDAETGKEMNGFPELPDMVTAISYSPKGQTIAVGTFQGSIAILDPLTGRMRQLLRAHADSISGLIFADKGQRIVSVSLDQSIRQWTVLRTPLVPPVQAIAADKAGAITAAAGTPDGKYVVVGGSQGLIHIWDMTKGRLSPFPVKQPAGITHIAVSEGMDIASIGKDGVLLVSSRDGSELWKGKGSFAAYSPDGKHLAVAEGRDIVFRDHITGKEEMRLVGGHDGEVIRLEFSPDGKLLASAGEDTRVRLWNVSSGEKLQETIPFGSASRITQLTFSPDGTRFAVSAHGPSQPPPGDMSGGFRVVRDVRVFTVPTAGSQFGAFIAFSPQPIDQPITAFIWNRTGKLLAMPASDGTVRINDFPNNNSSRETERFRAHDGAVLTAVSLGDSYVTVGEDLVLRKWKLP